MKKRFSLVVVAALLWCGLTTNVHASSYINENGVKIDSKVVDAFSKYIDTKAFDSMQQYNYDHYVRQFDNGFEVEEQYLIIEDTLKNGEIVDSKSILVNEDDFNSNYAISPNYECTTEDGYPCVVVSVFQVFMTKSDLGTHIEAMLFVNSLSLPSVRSSDVLAFRFSNLTLESAGGNQYADGIHQDSYNILYGGDINKQNFTTSSNGVGVVMPLSSKAKNYINLNFMIYAKRNGAGSLQATFLHANSAVSVSDAKTYSFASNGLGGVVKYSSSTIANKYSAANSSVLTYSWT